MEFTDGSFSHMLHCSTSQTQLSPRLIPSGTKLPPCPVARPAPNATAILSAMTGATHPPTADPLERIQCQWCQSMNDKAALSCRACGAPLDIRNLVSESGWRE